MREIKFRAWDKKKKIMSGSFSFNDIHAYDGMEARSIWFNTDKKNDEVEIGNNLGYSSDIDPKEFQKNLVFMQYTGLNDKNGVEIYEGYYLRKGFGSRNKVVGKLKVKWHGAGFGVFAVNKYQGWLGKDIAKNSEVIGNIYEKEDK